MARKSIEEPEEVAKNRIAEELKCISGYPRMKGKKELIQHLTGEKPLTARQAALAKCFECTGGFADGGKDCMIPTCALHPFMPYREGGAVKHRVLSDEHREKLSRNRFGRAKVEKPTEKKTAKRGRPKK